MTDTAARTKSDADIEIARPNDNIYLAGNMAPVEHEITADELPVTGEIPVGSNRYQEPPMNTSTHAWKSGGPNDGSAP